jgi:hypothetical protein
MSQDLSQGTLILLWQMLGNQTLTVGSDDFPDVAQAVLIARQELGEALAAATRVTETARPTA